MGRLRAIKHILLGHQVVWNVTMKRNPEMAIYIMNVPPYPYKVYIGDCTVLGPDDV